MIESYESSKQKAYNAVPSIFIHYFNDQMLNNYDLQDKYSTKFLATLLAEVTRVAFLMTDGRLLFPTIDVVQSRPLRLIFSHLRDLFESGEIVFCGSEVTAQNFISHKVKHFQNIKLYPEYFEGTISKKLEQVSRYWIKRSRSTTKDIQRSWLQSVSEVADENFEGKTDTQFLSYAYNSLDEHYSKMKFVNELYKIPERLDGQAFLWNLIETQGLIGFTVNPATRHAVELALAFEWLMSHLDEYKAVIFTHIPNLGGLDCGMCHSHSQNTINFSKILTILKNYRLLSLFRKLSNEMILDLKNRSSFTFFKRNLLLPKYFSMTYGINEPTPLILRERKLINQIDYALRSRNAVDLTPLSAFDCLLDILDIIASEMDGNVSEQPIYYFEGGLEIRTGDIIGSSGVLNFNSTLINLQNES